MLPTPEQYFRRRRRRAIWIAALAMVFGLALALADHFGWLLYEGDVMRRYHDRHFTVTDVVDCCRLQIEEGGQATRVRLRGVAPSAQPAADLESLRDLVVGRDVKLQLDPDRVRDSAGNLLAHVVFDDGSVLTERVLRLGLARAATEDRSADAHRHQMLELQARRDRIGLWAGPD